MGPVSERLRTREIALLMQTEREEILRVSFFQLRRPSALGNYLYDMLANAHIRDSLIGLYLRIAMPKRVPSLRPST